MDAPMDRQPTMHRNPFADFRSETQRKKGGFLLLVIPTVFLAIVLLLYSLGWR